MLKRSEITWERSNMLKKCKFQQILYLFVLRGTAYVSNNLNIACCIFSKEPHKQEALQVLERIRKLATEKKNMFLKSRLKPLQFMHVQYADFEIRF